MKSNLGPWAVYSGETVLPFSVRQTRNAAVASAVKSFNRDWRKLKREGCRVARVFIREFEFKWLLEEWHWDVCQRQLDELGVARFDNGQRLSVSGRIGLLKRAWKKSHAVTCPKCGNYVPGHATGAGDVCTCLTDSEKEHLSENS